VCADCARNQNKTAFLENTVAQFLLQDEALAHWSYRDRKLPCATSRRRPDFCYVLPDRTVILEVDESEHCYNTPECENRRMTEIQDDAPPGTYIVIVRFNPNPKRGDVWSAFETLAAKLKHAFVTDDVKYEPDGIHRIYINYSDGRKRKLTGAMAEDQRKALRQEWAPQESNEPKHEEKPTKPFTEQKADKETHVDPVERYDYYRKQMLRYAKIIDSAVKAAGSLPSSDGDNGGDEGPEEIRDRLLKFIEPAKDTIVPVSEFEKVRSGHLYDVPKKNVTMALKAMGIVNMEKPVWLEGKTVRVYKGFRIKGLEEGGEDEQVVAEKQRAGGGPEEIRERLLKFIEHAKDNIVPVSEFEKVRSGHFYDVPKKKITMELKAMGIVKKSVRFEGKVIKGYNGFRIKAMGEGDEDEQIVAEKQRAGGGPEEIRERLLKFIEHAKDNIVPVSEFEKVRSGHFYDMPKKTITMELKAMGIVKPDALHMVKGKRVRAYVGFRLKRVDA
jgi:sugar-specific transcriptional regulator TrmB